MIWPNMASTLEALAPDEASGLELGTKIRENDMMALKKEGQPGKKNGRGRLQYYYKLA